MSKAWIGGLAAVLALAAVACGAAGSRAAGWSEEETETIRSLWIGELEPLAPDPSNRYGDDPAAAALGHRLFFDTRLSSNGRVSCGTCHQPGRQFQDGVALASGVGRTDRRTMPIAGTAYSPWQFWDGRKDSQWAQALGPLESPVEHGGTRAQYAHVIARHYRGEYERIFGPLPDLAGVPRAAGPVPDPAARAAWDALPAERREAVNRVFANVGKAVAAYERRLQPGPSRFDRYAERLLADGRAPADVLTPDEEAGCACSSAGAAAPMPQRALLTDDHFHNTGVPAVPTLPPDPGRARGARQCWEDEFNCRSRYSARAAGRVRGAGVPGAGGGGARPRLQTPSLRSARRTCTPGRSARWRR
jgi:cytochrome c peroxidase